MRSLELGHQLCEDVQLYLSLNMDVYLCTYTHTMDRPTLVMLAFMCVHVWMHVVYVCVSTLAL